MSDNAIKNPGRRQFLCTAPVAAAAGFALTDASLFAVHATAQSAAASPTFKLIAAQAIQQDVQALQANPGSRDLASAREFAVVVTTETAKSAKEFEWHESRDHILQVLEGTTIYEVGGTPKNPRSVGPGEWLAPAADGASAVTLNKGDMLIIPRGVLHKRSTSGSVTFTLISPKGTVKA
jgi:quercetin dioxygenase-like cupin family protein